MAKDEVAVSDDMLLAFSTCVNADRLTLSSNLDVSSATLCRVIERLPKLVAVDISGCHLAADKVLMTLAATCANELQGLNISGCERIGDEGLLHLADTSIVLRRVRQPSRTDTDIQLKASKCIRLTDKSLVEIARNCPSLLEVDFAGLGQATSATVYAIFLNLSQLREFKFSHNPFITDAGFPNLPALTAMHQIDSELAAIRAPKYTTTRDLDPTSSDPPRMLMPKEDCLSQLKVVDLTDCPGFGDQGLENLIASAPCIRALTLAKCAALTDTGLQHIAKLGRNLQHLHLAHVAQ
jgi:F-box and leucine-rich repeat protein GRR1